jgi:hypothetical protein
VIDVGGLGLPITDGNPMPSGYQEMPLDRVPNPCPNGF